MLAAPSAGCSAGEDARAGASVVDSAGIRIVANEGPRWRDGAWAVDSTPLIVIAPDGSAPDDPRRQFLSVVAAFTTGSGGVVVVDRSHPVVKCFDRSGGFLRSAGGIGTGPGQFQRIESAFRVQDGILIIESNGRHAVYDESCNYVRSVSTGGLAPVAVLKDETVVGYPRAFRIPPPTEPRKAITMYATLHLLQGAEPPVQIDSFATNRFVFNPVAFRLPFSPTWHQTAANGRFHFTFGDDSEIRSYDRSGKLASIIRWPASQTPIQASDREEYRRQLFLDAGGAELVGASRDWPQSIASNLVFPEHHPHIAGLRADVDGNLWVARYRREDAYRYPALLGQREPISWLVFAPEGEWLAEVVTPPRFKPLEIGRDYLLGVAYDDDDVESIKILRLERPT